MRCFLFLSDRIEHSTLYRLYHPLKTVGRSLESFQNPVEGIQTTLYQGLPPVLC